MAGARYLMLLPLLGCDQLFKINNIDVDASVDVSVDEDAPVPPPDAVLPAHCFYEGFDAALNPGTWLFMQTDANAPDLLVMDHALVITPKPSQPGTELGSIRTNILFDFTDGSVSVELLEATYQEVDVNTETSLVIQSDATHRYELDIRGDQIVSLVAAGASNASASAAWDPGAFHWLRMRHDVVEQKMFWEAASASAPDTWNQVLVMPAIVPVTGMFVIIGAGTTPPGYIAPGRARFDNVLVSAPACNQ